MDITMKYKKNIIYLLLILGFITLALKMFSLAVVITISHNISKNDIPSEAAITEHCSSVCYLKREELKL